MSAFETSGSIASRMNGARFAELRLGPDSIHPAADAIEAEINDWAEQVELVRDSESFRRARFPRLAARIFPGVEIGSVKLYARWLVILFALDDMFDENVVAPPTVHRLYRKLERELSSRQSRSTSSLVKAVREQWALTAEQMSPAWRRAFRRNLRLHGKAIAWELELRQRARTPSLAEFMDLRPWANGMFMWDLIEPVLGCEVPSAVTSSLAWRYLRASSNDITAWRNDLASADREMAAGNQDNLVIVLARAFDRDYPWAVPFVEEQISIRTADLLVYQQIIRSRTTGMTTDFTRAVAAVVDTMRTMTAAHTRWMLESGRYPATRPVAHIPQAKQEASGSAGPQKAELRKTSERRGA